MCIYNKKAHVYMCVFVCVCVCVCVCVHAQSYLDKYMSVVTCPPQRKISGSAPELESVICNLAKN